MVLLQAIAADPADPALHLRLGMLLMESGDLAGAADAFAAAAALRPGWLQAVGNRGIALARLQRHAEAEAVLNEALGLKPDSEPVLTTLAGALQALGRSTEAAEAGRRAVAAGPDRPEAWTNLALALHALGQLDEAAAACERALVLAPHYALAAYNLAHVRNDQWRSAEARAAFARAVELDPRYPPAWHALLFNLLQDPAATEGSLWRVHRDWAQQFPATTASTAIPPLTHRLRVGYLSPDFRAHSCAHFLRPLFQAHDRTRVEIHAYSAVERPDDTTAWFRRHAGHWCDVGGLGNAALASRIRADGIHVLVDLAGHTRNQPLGVFALSPAPVQVAWLGYPATTGLTAIGYRLTDDVADPPGEADRWHSERLVRLPGGFLCYQPPSDAPPVTPLPATRQAYVTFGSFNNLAKVTPELIEIWSVILRGLPGSRLVLKGRLLAHGEARSRIAAAFAGAGIDPARVELRPWLPRASNPLAAYGDIDIALDTFPYNGTTTTFEALWMGVPVVSLGGRRHAARVGASILTHLGRSEWLAEDTNGYVRIALALAADLQSLDAVRAGLRAELAASTLMDAPAFARKIEAAFRELAAQAD
ncbi:MAG: tetratricopeptide repeat protein [Gammaproteobacteria bacterium]